MNEIAIGRFAKPGIGSVNTYWIEAEKGIVVIDGQRELSSAKAARAEIARTGKPILAVVLTHPHPDHFGGIGVFSPQGSGVPVYGSVTTRESIAQDRFGLVKASREVVKDDFPTDVTLPDRLVTDGEVIEIGGVALEFREWGEGEAECMTLVHVPAARALFCADVVQDRMTAFLLEGRSQAWLRQLRRLLDAFPAVETLYPGHGDPGPPDVLIGRQRAYLEDFRALVAAELRDGAMPDGAETRVADGMERRYPGYLPVAAIPDLLHLDIAPLAKELTR